MNPTKLKIKNFRGIAESEIDFSALNLASVVGNNGDGKSSLFTYSLLFVLFGKFPSGSIDDLVKIGEQDMSVQLDFEHNNEVYQITRTRSLKGKGKSTCELQKLADGRWEPLTGATIKETDAKIEQLLSLDASTFLASSLILQGDVNNFAGKLPSERKQVLSSILGLDYYATLQEQAKAKAKAVELKLEADKREIEQLSAQLDQLPYAEEEARRIEEHIALLAVDIKEKEIAISDAQIAVKDYEAKEQEGSRVAVQINDLESDISILKGKIIDTNNRIVEAQQALSQEPMIAEKMAELARLKITLQECESKQNKLKELIAEENRVTLKETELTTEEHGLAVKIGEIERELAIKPELEKAVERYEQESANLKIYGERAEKHQALTEQLAVAERELVQASVYLDGLLNEYHQLEKKTELLADAGCIDLERADCKFLQDALEAKSILPKQQAEIEKARLELIPYSDRKQDTLKAIEAVGYDKKQHTDLLARVESLQSSVDRYKALAGKTELLETLEKQKADLTDRIDELNDKAAELQDSMTAIRQELKELPTFKAKIAELETYSLLAENLPKAKAIVETADESMKQLWAEEEAKEQRQNELMASYKALGLDDLPAMLSLAKSWESEVKGQLDDLRHELNQAFARQGALNTTIDRLIADHKKCAELDEKVAPQAKELTRWETLVKAFSRNGIPVLILENTLPELERIANEILGEMSNGQHSLQFITQRDAKTKDSMIETLDIVVRDWAGQRPFESFSGGEQTRISLAIRFALSELLANRAGSRVEFLIMDEVLSDQSPEFRDMTIDSIKALSKRFKKILLISHIPEVQMAFEQQITVKEGGRCEVLYS